MGPGFESLKVHQKKTSIDDGGFSFGIIVPDSNPSKSLRALEWLCAPPQRRNRTYSGAKRGSESLKCVFWFCAAKPPPALWRRRKTHERTVGSRVHTTQHTIRCALLFWYHSSRFEPLQKPSGFWTCFALRRSAATAPYPGAKRGSESLTRRGFFVPYLSSLTAGDRRRPTDLCAFFTWRARVVWAVFRFPIAKSSVFSRRRKTPEKRSRSGRHDPYRVCVPFTWCAWVSMEFFKHQTVCSYPRRARRRRRAAHNR